MSFLTSLGGVFSDVAQGIVDPASGGRERAEKRRRQEESQTRMFEEAKRLEIARAAEKKKEAEVEADTIRYLTSVLGGDATEAARAYAAGKASPILTSALETLRNRGGMRNAEQLGSEQSKAELEGYLTGQAQNRYLADQIAARVKEGVPAEQAKREALDARLGSAVATSGISLVPSKTASELSANELSTVVNNLGKEFAPQDYAVRMGKNAAEAQDLIDAERLRGVRRDLNKEILNNQMRESLLRGQALTTATGEDGRVLAGMVNPAPSQAYVDMMTGVAQIRSNRPGENLPVAPIDPNAILSLYGIGKGINAPPVAETGDGTGNSGAANNGGKNPAAGFTSVPSGKNPPESGSIRPNVKRLGIMNPYSSVVEN